MSHLLASNSSTTRRLRPTVRSAPRFRLHITAPAGERHVPFLRRYLRAAHRLISPALRELSLAMVGDRRMAELHQQFMGIPGPTDVLTFPLEVDAHGHATSGEVIVCVPEARRQAAERGIPLEHELLLYAIHGILHLNGFDDRTQKAFLAMHRAEDDILTQLGFGPVFSGREPESGYGRRTPRAAGSRKTTNRRASAGSTRSGGD